MPWPRKAVGRFAETMEAKLQENDGKGGWSDCGDSFLLRRLKQELKELEKALQARNKYGKPSITLTLALQKECADVANFCMMISDNAHNSLERGM